MNLRPLWTAMVWPTKSGWMVDRRDQVRRTFLSLIWFMPTILVMRCSSMKGPFFAERDIVLSSDFLCCDAGYDESLACETWCCPLLLNCWIEKRNLFTEVLFLYLLRRLTMKTSVRLLLRVLYPRVGWPHGVTGGRPPEVLPSPPPCGWSTGFIDAPRLDWRIPFQR